jgi:hypothetical protein
MLVLYPINWQYGLFLAYGASRLLNPYWFRGLQGVTPSKSALREAALGCQIVTTVTRLTPKSMGEASRSADFDGVTPWRPLN